MPEPLHRTEVIPIIFVVVDGSSDGTYEMLNEEFSHVIIIKGNGNWWYTKSINKGIKETINYKCDYVLTLNDDIIFNSNYLEKLIEDQHKCGPESVMGSLSFYNSHWIVLLCIIYRFLMLSVD